jgi:hypothetical protein
MDPTCATTFSASFSRRKMMVSYASQSRPEHRLNLRRRSADHVEHVARRGLIFERFLQLRSPRLHLLEKADIVDGDHRLVGEGFQERDLLLGKRLHGVAPEKDGSKGTFAAHERHAEDGPMSITERKLLP